MTNREKWELRDMVRRGMKLERILDRSVATRATVLKYIKALRGDRDNYGARNAATAYRIIP